MKRSSVLLIPAIIFSCHFSNPPVTDSEYEHNWPQWRGPEATGYAPYGDPPVTWSETENVKWKTEIPGRGHSSPIVWDQWIIITTSVQTSQKVDKEGMVEDTPDDRRGSLSQQSENIHDFIVLAINRTDGSILWQTSVCKERPVDGTHDMGSWASNSPVTDGKYIYAYFGSRGLFCLDFEGDVIWNRDFGQMEKKMNFGEGSSPVLYQDKLIIVWDHEGDSYLYILDKNTGKDIKKIPRNETTSWATPAVAAVNGRVQVITSATGKIRSYDLKTGEIVWEGGGMTANVIPSPLVEGNRAYLMSGFRGNALMAINLTKAKGNIAGSEAILWEYNRNTPYTPSGLLANGKLYFLRSNNGNLTCLDTSDGKENYSLAKLEGTGTVFASPVGVKDRLYVSSQSGITYVIRQGPEFEIISKNSLEDGNFASPAIAGDEIFIRGFQYLYCISRE
jgi:outer membrane protein assembly factor BamB